MFSAGILTYRWRSERGVHGGLLVKRGFCRAELESCSSFFSFSDSSPWAAGPVLITACARDRSQPSRATRSGCHVQHLSRRDRGLSARALPIHRQNGAARSGQLRLRKRRGLPPGIRRSFFFGGSGGVPHRALFLKGLSRTMSYDVVGRFEVFRGQEKFCPRLAEPQV